MYTVFGKDFKFGDLLMPASRDDLDFGRTFFDLTEKLLAEVSLLELLRLPFLFILL